MNKQRGFTLIELVVVIIILGVLAAVAVPRFTDMSDQARNAAAKGVAGAISSATSMNYAQRQVSNPNWIPVNQANVCSGAVLGQLVQGVTLQNGANPTGDQNFRIQASSNAGANGNCTAALNRSTAECRIRATGTGAGILDHHFLVICAR